MKHVPWLVLAALAALVGLSIGKSSGEQKHKHISGFAWNAAEWEQRTKGLRTSYNPDRDLNATELTLVPGDPRWLDFVFWCLNTKVAEHQVEAYGGTEWEGPKGGVIFHWAPGSRWETHTLASFGFTIGHVIGEHRWTDTQFPDFFDSRGGVHGVNLKDRLVELDPASPVPWVEFLEYSGGASSPYYRYLFHQEAVVDPVRDRIYLIGGQGVGFEYTFERYYHEVREVLTDAKAYQFFQMYDRLGPGFAALAGWARNRLAAKVAGMYLVDEVEKWSTRPGVAKAERYQPHPPAPPVPDGYPSREAALRGEAIYRKQCAPCHGITGDGKGFLATGFDVKPRDFRQARYRFKSTLSGEYPSLEDLERAIRVGVPDTTMPAWGQFLTPEQISDLARYLPVFSPQFAEAVGKGQKPAPLPIPAAPAALASLAGRGKALYTANQCASCHGEGGRGDGPAAAELKDSWEQPIRTTDLTYKWTFKNGFTPRDLYRTLYGGLTGAPMPSYLSVIPDEGDRWALAAYVLSMSPDQRLALRVADYKPGTAEVRKRLNGDGRVIR